MAIIHRLRDLEDKLVVATKKKDWTTEEIEKKVAFMERFFPHELIVKDGLRSVFHLTRA